MPYQPMVEDISGQLLAKGRMAGINALSNGFDSFIQNYEQNNTLRNAAIGKFSAVIKNNPEVLTMLQTPDDPNAAQQNPNAPQVHKDVASAYSRFQKGNINFKDAAILGSFADSYQTAKAQAMQQKVREAELAAAKSQQAASDFSLQEARDRAAKEAAMNDRLRQLATYGQDISNAQAPAPPILGSLTYGNMAAQQGPMRQPTVQPMGLPTNVLGTSETLRSNANGTAPLNMRTMADAISLRQNAPEIAQLARMGVPITPQVVAQLTQTGMQTKSREEIADLNRQLQALKAGVQPRVQTLPDGTQIVISANGGITPIVKPYQSVQEQASAEREKTLAQEGAKSALATVDEAYTAGITASEAKPRLQQILKLYEHGAKSGWGQSAVNTLTGALSRAGLWNPKDQANAELLQSKLNYGALELARQVYKGQGAVSDPERARIDKVAMNIDKTKGANIQMVNESLMLVDRAEKVNRLRRDLANAGKSPIEIANAIKNWKTDNPMPEFGTWNPSEAFIGSKQESAYNKYAK